MRLIDATEFVPDTEWSGYDDFYISYSQLQIDNAPTVRAVVIPDNATNGDVIEALFTKDMWKATDEDIEWWNAPYEGSDTE